MDQRAALERNRAVGKRDAALGVIAIFAIPIFYFVGFSLDAAVGGKVGDYAVIFAISYTLIGFALGLVMIVSGIGRRRRAVAGLAELEKSRIPEARVVRG